MPDRSAQVLRVSSTNRTVILGSSAAFLFVMVCAVWIMLAQQMAGGLALTIVIAVLTIGLAWLLFRVATQSVRLDGSDVVLRYTMSSRRIPRADIVGSDSYKLDMTSSGNATIFVPRLWRSDGSHVDVMALSSRNSVEVLNNVAALRTFLGLPRTDLPPVAPAEG